MRRKDMLTIAHPDMEGTGTCTPDAYLKVWKDKGYEVIDGDAPVAATPEEPVVVDDEPEEPFFSDEE